MLNPHTWDQFGILTKEPKTMKKLTLRKFIESSEYSRLSRRSFSIIK